MPVDTNGGEQPADNKSELHSSCLAQKIKVYTRGSIKPESGLHLTQSRLTKHLKLNCGNKQQEKYSKFENHSKTFEIKPMSKFKT